MFFGHRLTVKPTVWTSAVCISTERKFNMWCEGETHLLMSHNEGTWFTCDIGELKQHSLRRHEGVKLYVCCECSKRFCTSAELRLHHLVHSDVKRFFFDLFDESIMHPESLVQHFKRCADNLAISSVLQ